VKSKHYLFIYDWREIIVLALIAITLSIFTFTLGVHWGKGIGHKSSETSTTAVTAVETLPDAIPNKQEFAESEKKIQQTIEDLLTRELHDEVSRTGIRLRTARQTELPEQMKSARSSQPFQDLTPEPEPSPLVQRKIASETAKSNQANPYSLQIGSFQSMEEARDRASRFEGLSHKVFLKETEVAGKGKWHRIYLGEFPNRLAAEKVGKELKLANKVQTFIVVKLE
jgi:cell division protein FtsN